MLLRRFFALSLLLAAGVASSYARADVNPLTFIKKQIQKPNMLVVLDTSGSMTGVPGSGFRNSSEVGVDCDGGRNCRGWNSAGACSSTSRPCYTDVDCKASYCKLGKAACADASDCPVEGNCALGGSVCGSDADCGTSGWGTCAVTGETCNNATSCGVVGVCSTTKNACTNIGKACKAGYCSNAVTKGCASNADCSASTGSCKFGATPSGGCDADSDCAAVKACDTGESCNSAADCPAIGAGYCSKKKSNSCTKDSDCGSKGPCVLPTNSCTPTTNTCVINLGTCNLLTGGAASANKCTSSNNSCVAAVNKCVVTVTNDCTPAPLGESCNLGVLPAAAIKMCQRKQTLCSSNADCKTAGDSCGAPTSRAVIAKRTLSRVIEESGNIVNFGLMTFYQSGYFPYYKMSSAGSTTTDLVYITKGFLEGPCFNVKTGPTASCLYQGAGHTLLPSLSSRYRVNNGPSGKTYVDAEWCGMFCDIPGHGTAKYEGSYYLRDANTGAVSSTLARQSTYTGKTINLSGTWYRYYDTRPDYYNGGAAPPISTVNCGLTCSASCGARWDTQLGPFLKPDATEAEAKANALSMLSWMDKGNFGGLLMYGGTPSGCTLENDVTKSEASSAYHYMSKVKSGDGLPCRQNFVLFLTDGEANGPGDSNCTATACSANDPEAAGCTCKAVLAAWHMRKNLGVRTFVVGFSSDVAVGNGRVINDNVAKAGGTDYGNDGLSPFAFLATNEEELLSVIQTAIFDAVRGSYATSPSTGSSGEQLSGSVTAGKYALDSRVDFPSWEGHLIAYDVSKPTPTIVWDANEQLKKMPWWERRIYLGARDGSAIRIRVDPVSKSVTNRDTLSKLGLGATAVEAEKVAKFMMGDPASGNKAILGAIINSTPIDVGQPGDSNLPGAHAFFTAYKARPHLTYVGSSDGMLHAFFTESTTVDGDVYAAGSEAFAYVPPVMVDNIVALYAQGGQVADPGQHIFGLANSPKVKNLCIRNCTDANTAIWRTVLVMNTGFGGNAIFALDVTNPLSDTGFSEPPVLPLWHSDNADLAAPYDTAVGLTLSVPAFTFNKTSTLDDHQLIFASGYRVDSGSTTQGRQIVTASVADGHIIQSLAATATGSCPQNYALLADVAAARDFTKNEYKKVRAAYVGDTWGTLWRQRAGQLAAVARFGCDQPLHFAPTVVQLDRDDPANHAGDSYLVQVTNSALDEGTAKFGASRLVVIKETVDQNGNIAVDTTFGVNGLNTLTVGTAALCAVTTKTGCTTLLPTNARPTATPLAILKKDGTGFQMMSMWYAPDVNGCGKGQTWLTLHEVVGNTVTEKQGLKVANEPVASPVVVGGKIMVVGSEGIIDIASNIEASYSAGTSTPTSGVGSGLFRQLGWMELP